MANADDDAAPAKPPNKAWKVALKRFGPYVIAAVAIGLIFTRYSPKQIAAEMVQGNSLAMFPWALATMVVSLLMVSAADTLVIRPTVGSVESDRGDRRPSYFAVLVGKASATLLNLLGVAAGHGGYALWIARRTGIGALITSGIILYLLMSDLLAMSVVLSLTAWVGDGPAPAVVRTAAPIAFVFFSLTILIGPYRLLGGDVRMFRPWHVVAPAHGFLQGAIRATQFGMIIVGTWAGANAFGVEVPLTVMAVNLPLIMIVGALPVNVAGFGAVQGAWLLLAPWAESGEQVLAFSVIWQLELGLAVVLRGLPFVRRALGEVADGARAKTTAP